MRISRDAAFGGGNTDSSEQLDDLLSAIPDFGTVQPQNFGDLVADAENRVQRDGRFLKNITDAAAADLADLAVGERCQFLTVRWMMDLVEKFLSTKKKSKFLKLQVILLPLQRLSQ